MILDFKKARESADSLREWELALEAKAQQAVQAERERIVDALRKRGDTEPTTADIRGFWYRAALVAEAK